MWRQVPVTEFGGLQLNQAADVVGLGGAIDGLNFDLDTRSALRSRAGYEDFAGLSAQPQAMTVLTHTDGTPYLIVGTSTGLVALQNGVTSVATHAAPGPWSLIRHGTPAASSVYCANGQGQIVRYRVSGGFTSPAGLAGQSGRFLSVSPNSNRLVVAREVGTTLYNSPSSVSFSGPNSPEDFTFPPGGATELDPGDGEPITGLALWREYLFVFKTAKFYVFYGESLLSDGSPEFSYREVDTGIGSRFTRGVAAGRQGVYFVARDGVYVTTGGPPERVSGAIDKLFHGVPDFWTGGDLTMSLLDNLISLGYHDERLYLTYDSLGGEAVDRMLVYDLRYDFWTCWETKGTVCVGTWFSAEGSLPLYGWSEGSDHKIVTQRQAGIDFDTDRFDSHYSFGFSDFGAQTEKVLREVSVWGDLDPGRNLYISAARDFQVHNGGVRLGILRPSAGTAHFRRAHARLPLVGSLFSLRLQAQTEVGEEVSWNVQRLILELRDSRMPGTGTQDQPRTLFWPSWGGVVTAVPTWDALITGYPTWEDVQTIRT